MICAGPTSAQVHQVNFFSMFLREHKFTQNPFTSFVYYRYKKFVSYVYGLNKCIKYIRVRQSLNEVREKKINQNYIEKQNFTSITFFFFSL